MHRPEAVLFDLDGTLLDTAPDLVFALNRMRTNYGLPHLPVEAIRPIANLGSKAMLKLALDLDEDSCNFNEIREQFLGIYQDHVANATGFFPNIHQVLAHLETQQIPWGIVTNKPTKPTIALLKALGFEHRPACIVCGDSLPKAKPHPDTILHACKLLNTNPNKCVYIGDAATDVIASKAAGTKTLVALYGYLHADDKPLTWAADGYINDPLEIIDWLAKYPSMI